MNISVKNCVIAGFASEPYALAAGCALTGGLFGLGLGFYGAEKITQTFIERIKQLQNRAAPLQALLYDVLITPAERLSNTFKNLKQKSFALGLGFGALFLPVVFFSHGVRSGCLSPNRITTSQRLR